MFIFTDPTLECYWGYAEFCYGLFLDLLLKFFVKAVKMDLFSGFRRF